MAYFEKRANGWRAQVRRKGWRNVGETFRTKAAAERWAREVEQEMDMGTWNEVDEAAPKTLKELLVRYLNEVSIKKKGHQDEKYRMNKILNEPLSQVPLERLTPSMLASWRDRRLEEVSSPTVRKDISILNHAIGLAMREWGVAVRTNPLDNVSRPANSKARDRRLNAEEHERLLKALDVCRNPLIKPIVLFAIETAMRRGEILSLLWDNVDLIARTAFLPETKNGDSRTVPLSEAALEILGGLSKEADYVFNTTAYSIRMAFDRAVKRAEIEDFRFHDLRHEATSRFFEKNLNVMEVSSITGHKDLRMLKRYTHLKAEDLALKL